MIIVTFGRGLNQKLWNESLNRAKVIKVIVLSSPGRINTAVDLKNVSDWSNKYATKCHWMIQAYITLYI